MRRILRFQVGFPLAGWRALFIFALLFLLASCASPKPPETGQTLPTGMDVSQVGPKAGSPAQPWDHGGGQECGACHEYEEQGEEPPTEGDVRAVAGPGPREGEGEEGEEGEGEGPLQRANLFIAQRAYPLDTIPSGARVRAFELSLSETGGLRAEVSAPTWVNIGPAPMRNSYMGTQMIDVSGRVTALLLHPQNNDIVYVGTALGGVWKTTDGGNHWAPLTDDQASLAVGAMAMDPRAPDTLYVGTGEAHPGLDAYYGAGILKTTNGGATWTRLGASNFTGLGISSLIVDPSNSNTIYLASTVTGVQGPGTPTRGVYRSTDGGNTWQGLLTCTDCLGASDLVIDQSNPATLYAAFWGYGVFKSTDRGANWNKLVNNLPSSDYGRIELGISASRPATLYAGYHYYVNGESAGGSLYKTTNGGDTWTWLQQTPNWCTAQCWYDNVITVDPTNPDVVYLGGSANYIWQPTTRIKEVVVKSSNGGGTWQDLSPNDSAARTLHPDVHAIVVDPRNPNTVWVGTDGGVHKSVDGGRTWVTRNAGLSTLQFTGIAIHPSNPSVVFGGMQDNNKAKTDGSSVIWDALDAGDGGVAAIDPFNPTYYYGSRYGISFQRNDQAGSAPVDDWPTLLEGINLNDASLFYAPFALDPSTQGVLYYGTYRLYRTTNRAGRWTAVSSRLSKTSDGAISTIGVAPTAGNTVYVGTSDGAVQVTENASSSWANLTKAPLPNRYVSDIAVRHGDPRTAYVVFNGFDANTPSTPGHIFKTTNRGQTWANISSNLPDVPVLSIVLHRNAPGTIYIGTDVGVFRSLNDGGSWELFSQGMPNVAVIDLALDPTRNVLVAGTHGRSVFRIDLGAAQATPSATSYAGTRTLTPTRFTVRGKISLPAILRLLRVPTLTATPGAPGTVFPTATPTLTPTVGRTATPTRTRTGPTPTATGAPSPLVFLDEFDNPSSGWFAGSGQACSASYAGGVYRVTISEYDTWCLLTAPTAPRSDGMYQVRVSKSSAEDGSIYGIAFGVDDVDDTGHMGVFWVDPGDATYSVERLDDGNWTTLLDWTSSNAIETEDGINVIGVRRQGNELRLYANGVLLYVVDASTIAASGYSGVVVWAGYEDSTYVTDFDWFKATVPTQVMRDDFQNPSSGWPVGAIEPCQATYASGEYSASTMPDYACVFRAPGKPRTDGYFAVQARRGDSFYPTAYGLMFGETGDFSAFYTFWVVPDTREYALTYYDGDWWGLTEDEEDGDAWIYAAAIRPSTAENTLAVERDSDWMDLYVNGVWLDSVYDDALQGYGYLGVANWASSYEPVTSYFDDYTVTVWDDTPALSGVFLPGAQESVPIGELDALKPRVGARPTPWPRSSPTEALSGSPAQRGLPRKGAGQPTATAATTATPTP